MKHIIATLFLGIIFSFNSYSQSGNIVLIEAFSETGCGACFQYDSAFQAVTEKNAEKVAVISYHCFYKLDPFYTYCPSCDYRYPFYDIKDGYPVGMVNGKKAGTKTAHLTYVREPLINKLYNEPQKFKLSIKATPSGKDSTNAVDILVKTTSLMDNPSKNLRVYVAITENNINYLDRYNSKSPNGIENFNHILRKMLPDSAGYKLGKQTANKTSQIKLTYTNDDKMVNPKEIQLIAFVQDMDTREILGTTILRTSPFKK